MKVLVTGSNGFVGKNLAVRLGEIENFETMGFSREHSFADLKAFVDKADAVVHLAGVNRPKDVAEYTKGNADLTARLCDLIAISGRRIPLLVSSSTQAEADNPYGKSKRAAELACEQLAERHGNSVVIYRLPGVFGKWCRPGYNSVVATFCYNIANDLPIQINDPSAAIKLVYVDDVIDSFIKRLKEPQDGLAWEQVAPIYETSLGDLAAQIKAFKNCRGSLVSERVGAGYIRALYATYVSYFAPEAFSYDLPKYGDERGVFVEMLKTSDSGQFSYFTALPGVTRGGHYHHTKSEKFLVIKGEARFGFRNIITDECYQIDVCGGKPQIVETVPGWTHEITNVGNEEMVVMLWANEIFDRQKPDTIANKV